ncbi:MAG: hypothetical protein ACRDT1_00695 [Micromonosporaceae bacterium]
MSVGGSHESTRPPISRRTRTILVYLALAVLLAPMTYIFMGFWSMAEQRAGATAVERSGARILNPLTRLIGELANAQSSAVTAGEVDAGPLTAAVKKVDAANQREGAALGVGQRWLQIRKSVRDAAGKSVDGQQAFDTYSKVSAQALALVSSVGNASQLSTAAHPEASGALLRLPEVIVHSGQVADLVAISAGSNGKDDEASKLVRVALDRILVAREAVTQGLRQGQGSAFSSAAGFDALDQFSSALRHLTRSAEPAADGGEIDSKRVRDSGAQVREGALLLSAQVAADLESRLGSQLTELSRERAGVLVAAGLGLLLSIALIWLSLPGPQRREHSRVTHHSGDDPDRTRNPDDAHLAASELANAHHLLNRAELIHVGRAVRAAQRGADDAFR